jgi:type I restriction enzyme S subunit
MSTALTHINRNEERSDEFTNTLKNKKEVSKIKLVPALRFMEYEGNWSKHKLDAISKIITGTTPSTSVDEFYNGSFLFVSPADMQGNRYIKYTKTTLTEAGFNKCRKIKKGSVLFVCIGSTIGKVAQCIGECSTNQQINALEAKENYSNDFIFSLLERNGRKIKLLAGVQAVPLINKTDFSNLKYYFPSLPEQEKIASFLSAVDEKIQQLTKKKALLEQYKKGVMQQLFSGQLRFKDEKGNPYPDWEEIKVQKLIDKKAIIGLLDGNHGELYPKSEEFTEHGVPYVAANSLVNGLVNFSECKRLPIERAAKFKKGIAINGDVLFAHNATVGPTAILKTEFDYVILSTTVTYYRCNNKILSNRYLLQYFNSDNFIRQYTRVMSQSTRNQVPITMQKKFKVVFPCIEEQQKIATYLSNIDTKIESVNNQITQTQTFKKGLLQQMFV